MSESTRFDLDTPAEMLSRQEELTSVTDIIESANRVFFLIENNKLPFKTEKNDRRLFLEAAFEDGQIGERQTHKLNLYKNSSLEYEIIYLEAVGADETISVAEKYVVSWDVGHRIINEDSGYWIANARREINLPSNIDNYESPYVLPVGVSEDHIDDWKNTVDSLYVFDTHRAYELYQKMNNLEQRLKLATDQQ